LSLAASPQAQAGTTSILDTSTWHFLECWLSLVKLYRVQLNKSI
jgi:hypothetical protein